MKNMLYKLLAYVVDFVKRFLDAFKPRPKNIVDCLIYIPFYASFLLYFILLFGIAYSFFYHVVAFIYYLFF